MAKVIDENEIILNGVYYRVSNAIRRFITSQFPGKITLGDYNLESNPITSTFVSSDHRGGIGIERMDPSKDLDRVWWSTGQLRHKDHFVLPKLVTASGSDPNTDITQFLTFAGVLYAAGGGFETYLSSATKKVNDKQKFIDKRTFIFYQGVLMANYIKDSESGPKFWLLIKGENWLLVPKTKIGTDTTLENIDKKQVTDYEYYLLPNGKLDIRKVRRNIK